MKNENCYLFIRRSFSAGGLSVFLLLTTLLFSACSHKERADKLFFGGTIYTVDLTNSKVECVVVKDGKIIFTGTKKEADEKYAVDSSIDLHGKFMYPGFIDAHCHFYGYAMDMKKVDLYGTKSWEEVLQKVNSFVDGKKNTKQEFKKGEWILGRGWDQNDWEKKEFPDNEELNKMFPDNPVFLVRVDGHAAITNQKALTIAGIKPLDKIAGGSIEITLKGGYFATHENIYDSKPMKVRLSGILIDNAMELVRKNIPEWNDEEKTKLLQQAQENCFAVGLTTISDAGLTKENIFLLDTLQKQGKIKMRTYCMVADSAESKTYFFEHGVYKTDFMHVCAMKFYADGALGSRGACLLKPYSDDATNFGFLLSSQNYFEQQAKLCFEKGFQMCTHCIGDSANRFMLNLYAKILGGKNNRRWRNEHCQVVNENDFHFFGDYNIVPSVQPCFATSDMPWAEKRIGADRMSGAYAWQKMLKQCGYVSCGSDFPVESINPLYGFYAAITRKDHDGNPKEGFQMQDALSRIEALRGMTIWAAFADFEEKEKGSIEVGKFADFTILDEDIMTAPEENLWNIKVLQTWIGGEKVY